MVINILGGTRHNDWSADDKKAAKLFGALLKGVAIDQVIRDY